MPFRLHESYLDRHIPTRRGSALGYAKPAKSSKRMSDQTESLISAGTSAATAFGLGFVEGKGMMPAIGANAEGKGGVSAELIGSAAILLAEYFGYTGKGRTATVLHDAAVGGLAYWAGVMGTIVGGRAVPGAGYVKTAGIRGTAHHQIGAGAPRHATMSPEELWKAQFR